MAILADAEQPDVIAEHIRLVTGFEASYDHRELVRAPDRSASAPVMRA